MGGALEEVFASESVTDVVLAPLALGDVASLCEQKQADDGTMYTCTPSDEVDMRVFFRQAFANQPAFLAFLRLRDDSWAYEHPTLIAQPELWHSSHVFGRK